MNKEGGTQLPTTQFFSIGEIRCSRSLTGRGRSKEEEKHISVSPFIQLQLSQSLNRPYASYLGGRLRSLSIEKNTQSHTQTFPLTPSLSSEEVSKKMEIAPYE